MASKTKMILLSKFTKNNQKNNIIICKHVNKSIIIARMKYISLYLSILIILSCYQNISNLKNQRNFTYLFGINQITLIIRGSGRASLFNSQTPSKIMINGYYEGSVSSSKDLSFYENTIKLIYNKVTSCQSMFQNCNKINEIDLSEFDSSELTGNLDYMFYGCSSLTSINFKNFKTSNINSMQYVFQGCEKLVSLDLSSFDTSKVKHFHYMFHNCNSLKHLDLSSFVGTSCECIHNMFNGCKSLTSLDLSNFDASKITLIYNTFQDCEKLEYVNLPNIDLSNNQISYYDFITKAAKNIVFCVKSSNLAIYNKIINSKYCAVIIINCDSNWRESQKKLVPNSNTCYDKCPTNSGYEYEYLGKCYPQCPDGTVNIGYICHDCHEDCKTCENNNIDYCKSCWDSNKYVKNGKCIESCSDGYYISSEDSSNKICECNLIQCSKCSIVSKDKKLCTSCNEGYYPLYNDPKNEGDFFDCYQLFEGYYLDKINEIFYYQKCYSSCETCDKEGNDKYHNCIKCNVEYELEIEFNEYKNCYNKCDNYYYLDDNNKLYCTNKLNCPDEYSKLIISKRQCINDCTEDTLFKYEFKKQCFRSCPFGTKNNEINTFFVM